MLLIPRNIAYDMILMPDMVAHQFMMFEEYLNCEDTDMKHLIMSILCFVTSTGGPAPGGEVACVLHAQADCRSCCSNGTASDFQPDSLNMFSEILSECER